MKTGPAMPGSPGSGPGNELPGVSMSLEDRQETGTESSFPRWKAQSSVQGPPEVWAEFSNLGKA